MFYLGPTGAPVDAKGMEDGLPMLKEMGLNAVEVQYTYGIQTKLETVERLGRIARENGIRISCHAPYYINLNSRDRGVLKKSCTWIHRTAEMMNAWGGYMLVHHPGFMRAFNRGEEVESYPVEVDGGDGYVLTAGGERGPGSTVFVLKLDPDTGALLQAEWTDASDFYPVVPEDAADWASRKDPDVGEDTTLTYSKPFKKRT